MSSSKHSKNTTFSTFDLKIIVTNLSSTKDLETFVTENLKWNHHINYRYRIASTTSFQVLKSFKSIDIDILKNLFLVYIRPKLEYNTPIWSPYLKKLSI